MNFSASMQEPGNLYTTRLLFKNPLTRLLMRISLIVTFTFISCINLLQASPARSQSMSTEKVTVGLKGESLKDAIRKIEQQTSLRFYYRNADIKNLTDISLPAETRTVEQILNEMLHPTFLSFRQIDNNILIEKPAQTPYQIKGRVLDINHQAIGSAAITIRELNTDKIIKQTVTDTSGRFLLQVSQQGTYLVDISAIGMDSLSVSLILADKQVVEMEDIILTTLPNNLKEVAIVRKKAYIEQRIDRTVINVGALISNEGANALEVLQKSPGVSVDINGAVSLRGRSGVLVLIDDKPTYLSAENLATYLRSLPSSVLDRIELMSNPPAKYDAEGGAGVINIKTKKSKLNGLNGSASFNLGQAIYVQKSASANMNYRTDKFNLFANGSYSVQKSFRRLELERNYFDAAGNLSSVFNQTSYFKPVTRNPTLKAGVDYYISPRTTIGLVFTGSLSSTKDKNPGISKVYNSAHVLDSTIIADNSSSSKFNSGAINLNFSHEFDTLGRVINFDADYVSYSTKTDQIFINDISDNNGAFLSSDKITNNLPSDISIYTVKTDYTHPLKGKAKFEAGLKSSYVSTDNNASYFNVINNISTINNNLTNQFLYKENINAAYLNFNKEFKRFSFQAGLRMENTNINGHQVGGSVRPDSLFTQHYTNLFPTAYLSYKLDTAGDHKLNFSYGRRIGRPYYQDLNPFIKLVDKFTYFSGNPFLRPQKASNYDLSYNFKGKLKVALYYNHTTDIQKETIEQDNGILISRVGNLGEEKYKGIYIDLNLTPFSWWESNTHSELMNIAYKGKLYDSYVDQNKNYFNLRLNNQFNLDHGWSAELSGWYLSSMLRAGQIVANSLWIANAGIQKKVLKDQGTIRLSARDIFHTFRQDGKFINIPNIAATYHNYIDSQVATIGFTYNFGSAGNKRQKRDTGGADSEKQRVKN